jgi:superfamily II DNA or RNA helicase
LDLPNIKSEVNVTTDIFVEKVSEVYLKVRCEREDIIQELNAYFAFKPPNADFKAAMIARKAKKAKRKVPRWNGKIYLFNIRTFQLPAGLLRYLITFASERKYSIDFAPQIGMMNSFSNEEAKCYIESLNITSQGNKIEARDYQIIGLAKSIRYKRMLLVSPTNSGKSYMMYCIARYLTDVKNIKRLLIIVPSTNLVEQLSSDFSDYGYEDTVHKIYEGHEKDTNKPITISTWQSLDRIEDREFYAQFTTVIGDEAHHFKAKSLTSIMLKLINAEYRIATTGTLDDWKVHRLMIEGLFGPYSKLTTTRKMIDEKQSSDLSIKALILKHPTEDCFIASEWTDNSYQREIDYLVGCESRNRFLINLALSLEGNTLMLFQFIEKHGDVILEQFIKKVPKNRKLFYVHGSTETEDRELIRSIIEKESDSITLASYGVFSEGVNIRNIHNIVFASPSKSKIRVLQSIGRGLRMTDTKTHMKLFDIADDLRINDYINYTLKHFVSRTKIYKSEEFNVSNYHIDLLKK